MRKTAALILTAVIFLLSVTQAMAFTIIYDEQIVDYTLAPIVLVVDGHTVETKEMPPIILNDRTLVPAREFFEELGCEVTWDGEARRVIVDYNGERIILTINSRTVYIGSNSASIAPTDPPPKIINDKTMIPVRFVAEEFGFSVEWLGETRTVKITSPDAEEIELTDVVYTSYYDADSVFIEMDEFVNPNVFRMENPDRIVIDLYSVQASIRDGSIPCEEGQAAKTIRYSQHPDRFRVVVDLKAYADYEIFKLKDGVEISIIKTEDFPEEEPSEDVTESEENTDINATLPNDDGKYVVILDPGHGGTDPGATYPVGVDNPSVKEKDLTLDIALRVCDILTDAGVEVIMTREGDTYPTLKERVEMANSSEADLYVSVHINAMDNKPQIDGAQVYYHEASSFGKSLASMVYKNMIAYTDLAERGIQDGSAFYVLKHTKMPAILTESGFITNDSDREYLESKKGRAAIADAIADGILEAFGII